MKTFIGPFLTSVTVLQLVAVGCSKRHETASATENKPGDALVEIATATQKKPEDALVRDVRIDGFPTEPNPGLDRLISEGPRAIPDLARLLQSTGSQEERTKAAEAMGAIAYRNPNAPEVHAAVPALMTVAQKGDIGIRTRAVQALGAIGRGASNATAVLIQLTQDADSGVRMCAVESLGRIGADSPGSLAALKKALFDQSDDVKITARQALEIVRRGHQ